jgi:predicted ATPase
MKEVKRVVIFGRSSSGKTAVIERLKQRGYQIGHETASIILDSRNNQEIDKKEIKKRQQLIYKVQKTLEDSFEGLVFLDRCLIDVFAYSSYLLGNLPNYFKDIESSYYHACFELERLPFIKTSTRIENDEEEAERIYIHLRNFYLNAGMSPIMVPSFDKKPLDESIDARVDFILSNIS